MKDPAHAMRKTLIVFLAASSIGLVFLTIAAVLTEPRVFMLATPTGNGDRNGFHLGWRRDGIYAIRYVTPRDPLPQTPIFQGRTNQWWTWFRISQEDQYLRITIDELKIAPKTALMAAALLALYPAIAFFKGPVKRWRRVRQGLCRWCGYNLTGNISGTCPECGQTVGA